jgi:hypothetical protein
MSNSQVVNYGIDTEKYNPSKILRKELAFLPVKIKYCWF